MKYDMAKVCIDRRVSIRIDFPRFIKSFSRLLGLNV